MKKLIWTIGLLATLAWLVLPFTLLEVSLVDAETYPYDRETTLEPVLPPAEETGRPDNIIIFVADGLGFAHLSLSASLSHPDDGKSLWRRFPVAGWQSTHPTRGFLTDSAASATALATGHDTLPGRIGVDADGGELTNLFEKAGAAGYRTGVVTDSYIWDATPTSFVVHQEVRGNESARSLIEQLATAGLEVLFGELEDEGEDGVPERAESIAILESGFTLLDEKLADPFIDSGQGNEPVAAVFDEEQVTDLDSTPNLKTMAEVALTRLSSSSEPFLLLVETEEMDSASHENDTDRMVNGLRSMEATLEILLTHAETDGNTLLLFTADHETGGLALSYKDNNSTIRPTWSSRDHTGVVVPVLAMGPGSDRFDGAMTNQQIGQLLHSLVKADD